MKDILSFVEEFQLNPVFFERNQHKAEIWFREAEQICDRLETLDHGIIAPTSGGKTVMALLSVAMRPKKTLFLVPIRRLTNRHQKLFEALTADVWQTRVVTGETPPSQRIWDDSFDQIIFATAHVVVSEMRHVQDLLKNFELIVFDEMHNAISEAAPYTIVASEADRLNIRRLALSASPGNRADQIVDVQQNCKLQKLIRINTPVPEQVMSVIHAEESQVYNTGHQKQLEEQLISELNRLQRNISVESMSLPRGTPFEIDHFKALGYREMKKLTAEINDLPYSEGKKKIQSLWAEYRTWLHIYRLATQQCFEAVEGYLEKTFRKEAYFVKRMQKSLVLRQLRQDMQTMLHPKMDILGEVMESLTRRQKQSIVFVDNKITAKSAFNYLSKKGVQCAELLGGGSMTFKVQEAVLNKMETKDVNCIIATTVLREGFDLSVDVIINITPPSSAIDMIQRSGRAGRHTQPAEIIYIATAVERIKIEALKAKVRKLKLVDFRNPPPVSRVLEPKTKPTEPLVVQPDLFSLDPETIH